jgi:hypothetical protein
VTWQNATHMHTTTSPNLHDRPTGSHGVGVAQKNAHCEVTARLNRGLGAAKNKALLVFGLLLALPVLTFSQTDPLSPTFLPSIDTKAADYSSNIWITDTMQKVRQDSGAPGTQHWGTFYGTQNEFVDFQVHVQAPAGGYSALSVTTNDFVNSRTGTHILASSTNIIVYREAYVHIQGYPSNNQQDSAVPGGANYNTFYGGALGYYPDILIPAVDPYWHQTTNAWPFNVAAGKNQSAWIDVLIPSNAPAGYYLGTVTVKNGTTVLAAMPVVIAVWQWPNGGYMPATATLKSYMYSWTYDGLCTQMYSPNYVGSYSCAGYPGSGGGSDGGVAEEWVDASLLVKDHRFSMGGQTDIWPQSGSFSTWLSYGGVLMNGTCNLHNGNGTTCPILTGSKLTTKQMDFLSSPSSAIWSNWQTNFDSNGWGNAGKLPLIDGLCDEPYPAGQGTCGAASQSQAFPAIVSNAATRHGFLSPGVPELVTTDIFWGHATQSAADAFSISTCGTPTCISNSIDIMVPTIATLEPIGYPAQPLSAYKTWVAGSTNGISRQWWSYLACGEAGTCANTISGPKGYGTAYTTWPNYDVDGKPAANRAMEWLTFMHGQTGELYYAGDVCAFTTINNYQHCVPSGNAADYDPWNGIYYAGGWGDGTLVYAGGVASGKINYMGAGVTTPIILPSVRLKHIRDGVQDYEYLCALTNAGNASFVQTQIATWITNSYTFETSGAGLRSARIALGTALHRLTYSALLQPPTNPNGKVQ